MTTPSQTLNPPSTTPLNPTTTTTTIINPPSTLNINIKQCPKHNLPQQLICIGELCPKRLGCQLCIDKHDHKFYLDTKNNQKLLFTVQNQIKQKLQYLQKYTKTNINNLSLDKYRQKIQKYFQNQLLYIKNKIEQELFNINLWIQKIQKIIKNKLEKSKLQMIQNWGKYNQLASKYIQESKEYQQLQQYFIGGDWNNIDHVQRSVSFLYSQELFFKFNRNLDALKLQISHHRKQDKAVMQWFEDRRSQFVKIQICPHKHFQTLLHGYEKQPQITPFIAPKTKQSKDDKNSFMQSLKQQIKSKAVLLYPQAVYEPFQNIYKLIRYDNQTFITSGSRAINLWSRISIQPQKSYPVSFPTYGILSFIQYGKDQAQSVIYGKSNGEMGMIQVKKEKISEMPAHQSAIRDIIQFDSYHFLTASQDWKLKLWAMATEKQKSNKKYFAAQRLTLSGHSGRVYALCKFGPNVLAGGSDGTIKLWDIMRQAYDQVFTQQKQIYSITELRPQLFISGGELKQIRVWDYRKTKSHICRYPIQHTCNTILRYDPNTIIFNDKNIVKVIDIRNLKQPIQRMNNDKCYAHVVNSMAFLSDNQIGMGGSDNIVSIWRY